MTSTLTATPTVTSTPTVTTTATATPEIAPPAIKESKQDRKQTEEQRQQDNHTNAGNRDDVYTEGNVLDVNLGAVPPYMVIGNRDGIVQVNLNCGGACPPIQRGDYVQLDGEQQNESLFDATEVTVTNRR